MTEVNFNAIRKNATRNFNKLSMFLNSQMGSGSYVSEFHCEEIQEIMDDLQSDLSAMNCCFIKDDDLFIDISDDVEFVGFNPSDEVFYDN